jgi:hypothetical protein
MTSPSQSDASFLLIFELVGDAFEDARHGLLQHRSAWPHALQR